MKNIPVLHVSGRSLAEAWEKSLLNLYENGTKFETQYEDEFRVYIIGGKV